MKTFELIDLCEHGPEIAAGLTQEGITLSEPARLILEALPPRPRTMGTLEFAVVHANGSLPAAAWTGRVALGVGYSRGLRPAPTEMIGPLARMFREKRRREQDTREMWLALMHEPVTVTTPPVTSNSPPETYEQERLYLWMSGNKTEVMTTRIDESDTPLPRCLGCVYLDPA